MTAPKITIELDILPANRAGQCHLCDGVINAEYPVYVTEITINNQLTTFRFCQTHFDEFAAHMDTFLMNYSEGEKQKKRMGLS